jgi:hypothetical protein
MKMAAANQNQANKEEEEIKAKEKALVNAIAFKNHREMADAPTSTISEALKLMACRVETVVFLSSFPPFPNKYSLLHAFPQHSITDRLLTDIAEYRKAGSWGGSSVALANNDPIPIKRGDYERELLNIRTEQFALTYAMHECVVRILPSYYQGSFAYCVVVRCSTRF